MFALPLPPTQVKSYARFGPKITYIKSWWWEGHVSKIKKLFIPSVTPRRRSWTRIKANIGRGIFWGFAANSNLLQAGLLVLIFCGWKLSIINLSLSIKVPKMHISQPHQGVSLNVGRISFIANMYNCHKRVVRRGNSENTQYTSIGIHSNLSTTSVWWRNGHLKDALEQPCRSCESWKEQSQSKNKNADHRPTHS